MIKITETPRDGMQGLPYIIPTDKKIEYINALLKCGFNTVETGSFVSPHAIPQMADTGKVLDKINHKPENTKIAVLVANKKGGQIAKDYDVIDRIFYPFSVSPTFLKKNLNTDLVHGNDTIDFLQNLCLSKGKELVVYLSLAFGNPYGDIWNIDIVAEWIEILTHKGIRFIELAETIGDIEPKVIFDVTSSLVTSFPKVEFGFHTHAIPGKGMEKVDNAFKAGIRDFDTVLGGLGGCPMTGKKMVPNLDLLDLLDYCKKNNISHSINMNSLIEAKQKLAGIVLS